MSLSDANHSGELLQAARPLLEEAVTELQAAGAAATDWQLAEAFLRLGKVYWALGGDYREDRQFAHKQWLAAAAIDSPDQVLVCFLLPS